MSSRFQIPPETMVITSTFVTEAGMPILEVSHDDDDEGGSLWQFHCGNSDYRMEKMQLVRLETILKIDPSVEEIAMLPIGETARRSSLQSQWKVGK